jgi:integrase
MVGRKYLVLKGRTWWFHRDIPAATRPAFEGQKTLTVNLKTSDLRVAQRLRDEKFRESEALFQRASADRGDPVFAAAMGWASEWRKWQDDPNAWASAVFGQLAVEDGGGVDLPSLVEDAAEDIARKFGPGARDRFSGLARGAAPLDLHLETHLAECGISPRALTERRTAVRRVAEWRRLLNLRTLGRKQAGEYVSEVLAKGHPKTSNKALSNLSRYWDWLVQRGHAEENPWKGQRVDARRVQADLDKNGREFTDAEILTLLHSPYPTGMEGAHRERLHDAMRIAALSGLRIEELCRLTLADTTGGVFSIRKAKTAAGVRKVPIHPDLVEIIERRTSGKKPWDYLIHEIDKQGTTGERSMPLSKQFTRYRRALKVDDQIEGQRRARITFHSWRRWFITAAEQGDQQPHIIAAVVGHKRQGMTLGRYSGGPSVEQQMRACVEAVRLPIPLGRQTIDGQNVSGFL